jgi:hypothetical protein
MNRQAAQTRSNLVKAAWLVLVGVVAWYAILVPYQIEGYGVAAFALLLALLGLAQRVGRSAGRSQSGPAGTAQWLKPVAVGMASLAVGLLLVGLVLVVG